MTNEKDRLELDNNHFLELDYNATFEEKLESFNKVMEITSPIALEIMNDVIKTVEKHQLPGMLICSALAMTLGMVMAQYKDWPGTQEELHENMTIITQHTIAVVLKNIEDEARKAMH